MEISEELKHVYDRLSVNNRKFLRFVESTYGGLERETYNDLFKVNDYLFKMQPWPMFFSAAARAEIGGAAAKVFDLIKSIPLRVFDGDYQKMSDYYEIPVDLIEYFLSGVTQEHLDGLVARGDFVMSPQGMKCIEFNVNTNLGGLGSVFWQSAYLSVPLIRRFLQQEAIELRNRGFFAHLFDHIIDDILERFPRRTGGLNVACVMLPGGGTMNEAQQQRYLESVFNGVLQTKGQGLKGSVVICDYSRLSVTGDTVFYRETPIHAMFELCMGYVPPQFTEAFKAGGTAVYNGAITWLMSTKLNFALLSEREDSDVFSSHEQETIKKHIPWTRKVTPGRTTYKGKEIDLVDFILAERERLVLKPLVGSGGKDVYIGARTAADEWEKVFEKSLQCKSTMADVVVGKDMNFEQWKALMEKALSIEQWLVQEYATSYPFVFQHGEEGYVPHDVSWGLFVFGSRYSGGWARVLPSAHEKGVVNAHQGAESILIFDVDE
jgi:hypothetical protein